ncbi:MAG: C40 family peptidase [Gemmatimonadota bacterium]
MTPWAEARRALGGKPAGTALARVARLAAPIAGVLLVTGAGWPMPIPLRPGATPDTATLAAAPAPAGSHRVQPDVLIVSRYSLPSTDTAAVQKLRGVRATEVVDAAKIQVNGKYVQVLGVAPATFRPFAARPTATAAPLWNNVANGQLAVSYLMGKQDKLPVGATARVAGRTMLLPLQVGGIGTVGIAGVDAVVNRSVAQRLGFPIGNAMVVSAPHANLTALRKRLLKLLPADAQVQVLTVPGRPADSTAGATTTVTGGDGRAALTPAEDLAMLRSAYSRVGMPYVWGAAGPTSFDCSGLVQWSFARAGVAMPRVAADQARTGPAVTIAQLQPGDLLFYHTDPTAPGYISHVAIYVGRGQMLQAPQPGQNVELVPADFGPEYAGAVQVSPAIAAQVAGVPLG